MSKIVELEAKEPNREEIQKILKKSVISIFNQIKTGCSRKICYNTYCHNNNICRESKL